MGKIVRTLTLGTVIAGMAVVGASTGAQAGVAQGQVFVNLQIVGEAAANFDTVQVEVYDTNGVVRSDCDDSLSASLGNNDVYASGTFGCQLDAGTDYSLGVSPLPPNYDVLVSCGTPQPNERIVDDNNAFTIELGSATNCFVALGANMAVLTKDVVVPLEGGPATPPEPGDFTLEVYDGDGALYDSGQVAPSPECDWLLAAQGVPCFYTDLETGDYSFGEEPMQGYWGRVTGCTDQIGPDERFDDPLNETVTVDPEPFGRFFLCNIENTYGEGDVTLTKTITNDDGGTAALGDFTLELYDGDGTLVDSGVCADDGMCVDGTYPIGPYTVGEVGPAGYTRTVTQEILMPTEALTEPEASFELGVLEQVTVNVASDDIATTTTTTTSTIAPTTTMATTTIAPTTTAFEGGGATLPPTGDDSTSTVAMIALGLLVIGGAGLLLARR
jgi:LPXTG-motif cell wall-anchored protein